MLMMQVPVFLSSCLRTLISLSFEAPLGHVHRVDKSGCSSSSSNYWDRQELVRLGIGTGSALPLSRFWIFLGVCSGWLRLVDDFSKLVLLVLRVYVSLAYGHIVPHSSYLVRHRLAM